jgi:hypothetical protein
VSFPGKDLPVIVFGLIKTDMQTLNQSLLFRDVARAKIFDL